MASHVICQFRLSLPPEQVWDALKDVEGVAHCFPGVMSVEALNERACKGVVQVRLGPMQLEFAGQFLYTDLDDVHRCASADAQGQDRSGRGRAESKILLRVRQEGTGSVTTVEAKTELSGTVAQFGRAKSVIQAVAETLIGSFAKNLEAKLAPVPVAELPRAAANRTATANHAPVGGLGLACRALMQWLRGMFSRA
ncbi:SRPBCC family protein [Paraburkholderia guartelaensis]|uniref:SRPBCC family protein n=1 Tax=Paraburkholderia guartelaensis TaxID=2546446 RepID=UPI002AB5F399|nr:SRPBCC family protein [Paraburkholderia guartelaensis]